MSFAADAATPTRMPACMKHGLTCRCVDLRGGSAACHVGQPRAFPPASAHERHAAFTLTGRGRVLCASCRQTPVDIALEHERRNRMTQFALMHEQRWKAPQRVSFITWRKVAPLEIRRGFHLAMQRTADSFDVGGDSDETARSPPARLRAAERPRVTHRACLPFDLSTPRSRFTVLAVRLRVYARCRSISPLSASSSAPAPFRVRFMIH